MKIQDVINRIETYAPLHFQESYDNSGIQVGNSSMEVKGILLTIDITEEVLEEAVIKGCNLVIAHHPLIFLSQKKITGSNYIQRCIIFAIKHDITIYASHTNMDKVRKGVSWKMAEKINLKRCKPLAIENEYRLKLVTFVPNKQTEQVANALYKAGAGIIGNYSSCSYRSSGLGSFKASDKCHPFCGNINEYHIEPEDRLEVILDPQIKEKVIEALLETHPYECPAYDLYESKESGECGLGCIGELDAPTDAMTFLKLIKKTFKTDSIKYTSLPNHPIKKIALCGGAGIELLPQAKEQNADIFITGDVKYHQFFDADKQIVIADIGHYESEQFTKEIFYDVIYEKNANFVVQYSEIKTNPIKYL